MKLMKTLIAIPAITGALIAANVHAAGVDELPANMQAAYQGLDKEQPVGPSAYRDFKAKKGPPWTIGYASSYAGNSWRAASMDSLMKKLLPEYQKAGLVKDVVVTQSDLKDSVQIQQMRQLVDQGVDAIILCCSNITALNQTIEYAHSKGVPVFSFSGYVTSQYAVSESSNYVDGGYKIASSVIKKMGAKGNMLLVSGIPGLASSDSFDAGVKKALAENPGVKLAGTVQGKWTDQVAQVEVQKFLATNPGKIDGIVVQSPAEVGVLKALQQSGRPIVPISLAGEVGTACYWRKNPGWVDTGYFMWPPANELYIAWNSMIRTLQGQGPKVASIVRPVMSFSHADVMKLVPADCKTDDVSWFEPGNEVWFPKEMADTFFLRPQDPLKWKP